MSNDNIVSLVDIKKNNEKEEEIKELTAEDVFKIAIENKFKKVVVIGYTEDDDLGLASNITDPAEIIYGLELAKLGVISQ